MVKTMAKIYVYLIHQFIFHGQIPFSNIFIFPIEVNAIAINQSQIVIASFFYTQIFECKKSTFEEEKTQDSIYSGGN